MRRFVTLIVSTLLAGSALAGATHLADPGSAQAGGFSWPSTPRP